MKDIHSSVESSIGNVGLGEIATVLSDYIRSGRKPDSLDDSCDRIVSLINEFVNFDPKQFLLRQGITYLNTPNDFALIQKAANNLSGDNGNGNTLQTIIQDALKVRNSTMKTEDVEHSLKRLRQFLVFVARESLSMHWGALYDEHFKSSTQPEWQNSLPK